MITLEQAATQALRLRNALPGRRDPEEVIEDRLAAVAETLRELARDEQHAGAIVTRCIRYCKFVPTPVEVEEQSEALALKNQAVKDWKPGNVRTIHHVRSDIEFWRDVRDRTRANGSITRAEAVEKLAELERELDGWKVGV